MAKNYFYNLLLTLANLLFPVLSFPYVSRILGPEGIGKVQFVFSFAQYFALIASIGIPVYGMKEIARHKGDYEGRSKIFSELIAIYLVTSVCLTAIYLLVIFNFPYFKDNQHMYLVAGLMILFGFSYIEWLYSGMEEFKNVALRSVAFKIVGLVLLYTFIRDRGDFRTYLYIMMFSFLGNNFLSFFLIRDKVKPVFRDWQLRRHVMPLLFILGTSLAASMYTDMDTVLLGFLSNDRTVGLYTAAVKLSKIAIPFVTSMGVILVPKISKDFADHNLDEVQRTLDQTFKFLAFFAVPVVFGLAVLAPEFIALFSGAAFLPATGSMRLLSLLPLIIGFGHFFLYLILIPSGRNREMFFCVLSGLFMSLLLNLLLTPSLKEVGSSIANVCSEIVVSLMYFYFIRKYFSFKYDWLLLGKAVLSALVFIPVIWLIREFTIPLAVTVILSIVFCAASYVATQWLLFRNVFILEIIDYIKMKLKGETEQ